MPSPASEKEHLAGQLERYMKVLQLTENKIADVGGPTYASTELLTQRDETSAIIAELTVKLAPRLPSYQQLEAIGGTGQAQINMVLIAAQDVRLSDLQTRVSDLQSWFRTVVILLFLGLVLVSIAVTVSIILALR